MKSAVKVKLKVHTLDIAPIPSESRSPPQKRSGMARVLKGFQSFTCTPTRSSAIGMSHTCLCNPSRSWYSFTDLGGLLPSSTSPGIAQTTVEGLAVK